MLAGQEGTHASCEVAWQELYLQAFMSIFIGFICQRKSSCWQKDSISALLAGTAACKCVCDPLLFTSGLFSRPLCAYQLIRRGLAHLCLQSWPLTPTLYFLSPFSQLAFTCALLSACLLQPQPCVLFFQAPRLPIRIHLKLHKSTEKQQ